MIRKVLILLVVITIIAMLGDGERFKSRARQLLQRMLARLELPQQQPVTSDMAQPASTRQWESLPPPETPPMQSAGAAQSELREMEEKLRRLQRRP